MAMPALKFESEKPVEERIAKLETHVEHMTSDISAVQVDVRRLNDKIDALKDLVISGFADIAKRFSDVDKRIADVEQKLRIALISNRIWFLLTAAAILGVLARGFKWI
jgi:hypothetical protein